MSLLNNILGIPVQTDEHKGTISRSVVYGSGDDLVLMFEMEEFPGEDFTLWLRSADRRILTQKGDSVEFKTRKGKRSVLEFQNHSLSVKTKKSK